MKIMRVFSFALILAMLLASFVSCVESDPSASDASKQTETSKETEKTESEEPSLPSDVSREASEEISEEPSEERGPLDHLETRFLDCDIIILSEEGGGTYRPKEIAADEETVISQFVKERNDLVEDKLGVRIKERRTGDMARELRNAALNTPDFDIAMPFMTTAGPLITEDVFYDLFEFDVIRFNEPYWDANAVSSLSLGNKLYIATGDFSVNTIDVTHCMIFNKDVVTKYSLESPYTLVSEGRWTLDKMLEMAKAVTAESDGIEGITYKDTIGLFINNNYSNSLYIGSGQSFVSKDANDMPYLAMNNEYSANVVQKVFDVFHDDAVIRLESFSSQARADGYNDCYWAGRDRLANGNALFDTISLNAVLNMASYDANFGFLVTPKYSEEQDGYHSYISIIYATGCVIPIGNEDPEKAALVLEALCASSTSTVKFNYYDRILKIQQTRDEESEEMLDLILNSRVYDLGALYNWGGIRDFLTDICATGSTNTFVSSYAAKEGTFLDAMNKTVEFLGE